MPRLFEHWVCPNCTMGIATYGVTEISVSEIQELFAYLHSVNMKVKSNRVADLGRAVILSTFDVGCLTRMVDAAVLMHEQVVIPYFESNWGHDPDLERKLLYYRDAGILLPLDLYERGLIYQTKLARSSGGNERRAGREDLIDRISEGPCLSLPFEWFTAGGPSAADAMSNLVDMLTEIDFSAARRAAPTAPLGISRLLRLLAPALEGENSSLYSNELNLPRTIAILEGVPRSENAQYAYEFEVLRNRALFALRHMNQHFIFGSSLGIPVMFGDDLAPAAGWKFHCLAELEARRMLVLRQFCSGLRLDLPDVTSFKEIIRLRETGVAREFRDSIDRALRFSTTGEAAATELRMEYLERANRLNDRARSIGSAYSAILAGSAATAGALIGSGEGALVGGIGASLGGFATQSLVEKFYRATSRDWAYYVSKWRGLDDVET